MVEQLIDARDLGGKAWPFGSTGGRQTAPDATTETASSMDLAATVLVCVHAVVGRGGE
jgi:hypothetical protein